MTDPLLSPEERFASVVEEMLNYPDVTPPEDEASSKKKFGSSALKVQQKIFAMLVRGSLVVKLPKARVDALVASGEGEHYDPGHDGRLMKEWLVVAPTSQQSWKMLAQEARDFVASKR